EEVLDIAKAVAQKVENTVILSDNPYERSKWLRNTFDFLNLFDKVYFSSEVGVSKDNKEAFENVLREFNVMAEETFFVDDSKGAIQTANSLGINTHKYTDPES